MGRSSAKLALLAVLCAASPFLASCAGDIQSGLDVVAKAARGVCWSELLHQLPPIDEQGTNYGTCLVNIKMEGLEKKKRDNVEDQLRKQNADLNKYKDMIDENTQKFVIQSMKTYLSKLPPKYVSVCGPYMDNPDKAAPADYSSILGDSSGNYPFKGLAHCFMDTIKKNNGQQGLTDLKSHWDNPKSFHDSIIERENENRARHGVPALKLDNELNTRAQRYADILAKNCVMKHIEKEHPDTKYKDGTTGENLGESDVEGGNDADAGVVAANGWYTEINNYPWPQWTGHNEKGVIGHFTASVWKSSQLAGYGVAKRNGCNKWFVVARYYPAGNVVYNGGYDRYRENVLPPL